MATSTRLPRLSLLGRIGSATIVWLLALVVLLAIAPGGAAAPAPSPGAPLARVASLAQAPEAGGVWSWPLEPAPRVNRTFERPASTYGAGHRGLDLAAARGQPVLAVADGIVSHSGEIAGRGTVSVLHASGLRSTYEPVDERVAEGTAVAAGARLGVVGSGSHCAPVGACLHLGARLGEDYLDPLLLLTRVRIVLLPLLSDD